MECCDEASMSMKYSWTNVVGQTSVLEATEPICGMFVMKLVVLAIADFKYSQIHGSC